MSFKVNILLEHRAIVSASRGRRENTQLFESQALHGTQHPGPQKEHTLPTCSNPLPRRCSCHSCRSTGLQVAESGSQTPPPRSSDDRRQHHGAGYGGRGGWGVTGSPHCPLPPGWHQTSVHLHCQPRFDTGGGVVQRNWSREWKELPEQEEMVTSHKKVPPEIQEEKRDQ